MSLMGVLRNVVNKLWQICSLKQYKWLHIMQINCLNCKSHSHPGSRAHRPCCMRAPGTSCSWSSRAAPMRRAGWRRKTGSCGSLTPATRSFRVAVEDRTDWDRPLHRSALPKPRRSHSRCTRRRFGWACLSLGRRTIDTSIFGEMAFYMWLPMKMCEHVELISLKLCVPWHKHTTIQRGQCTLTWLKMISCRGQFDWSL